MLVFDKDGTYTGVFVTSQSAGLGKVWDVVFGPDGDMYASDNTYNKIRSYDGTTGAAISGTAGWASTVNAPYGLTWYDNELYVATALGIRYFDSAGTSQGLFGEAHSNPTNSTVPYLINARDVVFCPDNRMYVATYSADKIFYYDSSSGNYIGAISGTSSPDTDNPNGVECVDNVSLYQAGDDPGRVNKINLSDGSLDTATTSLVDEPYGLDLDGYDVLYVANKDDDNILKIYANGTSVVFNSLSSIDDPRGLILGPVYSSSSSSSSTPPSQPLARTADNDEPDFEVYHGGAIADGTIVLGPTTETLTVSAVDFEQDSILISILDYGELPGGLVTLNDYNNGTATITLNSTRVPVGAYSVSIVVSDEHGEFDFEPFAVIVP